MYKKIYLLIVSVFYLFLFKEGSIQKSLKNSIFKNYLNISFNFFKWLTQNAKYTTLFVFPDTVDNQVNAFEGNVTRICNVSRTPKSIFISGS